MVDIPGPVLDADTAAHLTRHGVRSVCLFGKNIESAQQLSRLCADLREVLGDDALIALDHEGGAILRPTFWPFAPSAMSLGAANDPALTEQVNAALARQLRSVGINWNFAPVLDVNVNPANPVIGERAYGADAALVTRHGRAALAGHAAAGVAACVKHFPGHGDTHLDSHKALPRVSKSRAELDATEFAPFRDLLPVTPAIMTAHIVYDALDAVHPTTLSRPILTDLLRTEWSYDGITLTDSMGMQAIDSHYGRGEAAVLALRAGADLVMALGRRDAQEATLNAMQAALPTLNPTELDASFRRLHTLAAAYPSASTNFDPATDAPLFAEAWARGLSAYSNSAYRQPTRQPTAPPPGSRILLVAQRRVQRENVSEASVDAETLARELGTVYSVQLHAYDTPEELDWAAIRAAGLPIILATTTRHRQSALLGVQPDLHLALYNPYAVLDVDSPAVVSFGFRPEARAALLGWLGGGRELTGRLPFAGAIK
jgi:beta-N-acetylhexosaminidase